MFPLRTHKMEGESSSYPTIVRWRDREVPLSWYEFVFQPEKLKEHLEILAEDSESQCRTNVFPTPLCVLYFLVPYVSVYIPYSPISLLSALLNLFMSKFLPLYRGANLSSDYIFIFRKIWCRRRPGKLPCSLQFIESY